MTVTAPASHWAAGTEAGLAALERALDAVAECWRTAAVPRRGPYSGASPEQLEALAAAVEVLPEEGRDLGEVLSELGGLAVAHAVDLAHPRCAAHLQCAPLAAAVAADALVSATNASLDSWDQSPVAGHLEQRMVRALAGLAGLDPGRADGVFTSGGTQSNLMALLLARDAAAAVSGRLVAADGLGPEAARYRILCSEAAHFTVQRSASVLGLGSSAVETIPVDASRRMRCDALDERLAQLTAAGLRPIALVATAGTTDFGSIDPLGEIAARARRHRLWLHVDASYGGALLLSDRHRPLLAGLDAADSVAVDFHKLLWQPIACGALLVAERAHLAPLAVDVPYLNGGAEDGGDEGWRMPHLLSRSLSTSRRFDALKLLVSLHTLGRRRLGELVDRTLALTVHAARRVDADPRLEPSHEPALASLVLRYVPQTDTPQNSDRLNAAIRDRLLAAGSAVVGRTLVAGRVHLKLTLLNPTATESDVAELVDLIARTGGELDREGHA
ncbi:MAG TPA: pyridoxal-dependent decarboxylase [Candidatus Dormibacteraeota bacterium]|nr:pyridoxal-dependent decarboxylase [Candidatus Dormibacteraeota bacterium]